MIKKRLEHRRLEVGPGDSWRGGDRNEVAAEEHAFNHSAVEEGAGERRCLGGFFVGEIACARVHNRLPRKKLAGGGVGCLFSADEHKADVGRHGAWIKETSG